MQQDVSFSVSLLFFLVFSLFFCFLLVAVRLVNDQNQNQAETKTKTKLKPKAQQGEANKKQLK